MSDREEFTRLTPAQAEAYMADRRDQPVRAHLAARALDRGRTVLDAGCGNALADAWRYAAAARYVGADVSRPLLAVARVHFRGPPWDFVVADLAELPFPDRAFDVAVCKSVLVHLPSQDVAVAVVLELLRVARRVILAWAGSPFDAAARIARVGGHFGHQVYQNTYDRRAFPVPHGSTYTVHDFEVWEY